LGSKVLTKNSFGCIVNDRRQYEENYLLVGQARREGACCTGIGGDLVAAHAAAALIAAPATLSKRWPF
jgi:hypothetical protein